MRKNSRSLHSAVAKIVYLLWVGERARERREREREREQEKKKEEEGGREQRETSQHIPGI
jgi:hypothetical protein